MKREIMYIHGNTDVSVDFDLFQAGCYIFCYCKPDNSIYRNVIGVSKHDVYNDVVNPSPELKEKLGSSSFDSKFPPTYVWLAAIIYERYTLAVLDVHKNIYITDLPHYIDDGKISVFEKNKHLEKFVEDIEEFFDKEYPHSDYALFSKRIEKLLDQKYPIKVTVEYAGGIDEIVNYIKENANLQVKTIKSFYEEKVEEYQKDFNERFFNKVINQILRILARGWKIEIVDDEPVFVFVTKKVKYKGTIREIKTPLKASIKIEVKGNKLCLTDKGSFHPNIARLDVCTGAKKTFTVEEIEEALKIFEIANLEDALGVPASDLAEKEAYESETKHPIWEVKDEPV